MLHERGLWVDLASTEVRDERVASRGRYLEKYPISWPALCSGSVEIAVCSLHESCRGAITIEQIVRIKIVQDRNGPSWCQLEHHPSLQSTSGRGGPVKIPIVRLNHSGEGIRSMCVVKTVDDCGTSSGRHLKYRAKSASAAIEGRAVEVTIGSQEQRGVRSSRNCPKRGKSSRGCNFVGGPG